MVDEKIIQEAAKRLAERFQPWKIVLFGSQARGEAGPRSDVDLLVVCDCEGRRRRLMVEMNAALGGLGFAKDIVVITPEEMELDSQIVGTVARSAAREGRLLYEHSQDFRLSGKRK
ncbi:MAG: nucleotidyltransferase domain-containing protein [Candidatus Sumerlaeota bacterium]|nr:nucleotidyltransferase domain-containing protein [Candidatus Sumerlaeota bacterium]